MVEYFTKDEHATELSGSQVTMVDKVDEIFEEKLKTNFRKLVKDPSQRTIENILNYSKSLNQ